MHATGLSHITWKPVCFLFLSKNSCCHENGWEEFGLENGFYWFYSLCSKFVGNYQKNSRKSRKCFDDIEWWFIDFIAFLASIQLCVANSTKGSENALQTMAQIRRWYFGFLAVRHTWSTQYCVHYFWCYFSHILFLSFFLLDCTCLHLCAALSTSDVVVFAARNHHNGQNEMKNQSPAAE